MKKLFVIGLAMLMVLSLCAFSYADSMDEEKEIEIEVHIPIKFGFEIWDTEYTHTLYPFNPTAAPGDEAAKTEDPLGEVHFYVTSNKGIEWKLCASSAGVVTSGPTAPFLFATFGVPPGATVGGTVVQDKKIETAETWIYKSGPNERYVKGFVVHSLFLVNENKANGPTKDDLPATEEGESWECQITLTMVPGH